MREKLELEKIAQGGAILFIIYICFNYFFGCNETKPTMLEERLENKSLNHNEINSNYKVLLDAVAANPKLRKKNDSIIKRRSDSINYKFKKIKHFGGISDLMDGQISVGVMQEFTNELNESSKAYEDSLKIIAADKQ
tara:strand:+ start:112 stop:522 length:411 start_codon:yes stop_codon:yes gene_type:complete